MQHGRVNWGPVHHGPVYGGGFHRGPVYGGGFHRGVDFRRNEWSREHGRFGYRY